MDDHVETLILVDAQDRQIGTAEKIDGHRRGLLHRAFSVVVWSRDGRMLLQQRHARKYHSGGMWTNTCCGHPRPGEDIATAAHRRLGEEMGFDCALTPLGSITYRADFDNGLTEHEVVHIFRGVYDGVVVPHPEEVDAIAWKTLAEVRQDVMRAPRCFSVWFRQYIADEWPTALAPPEVV